MPCTSLQGVEVTACSRSATLTEAVVRIRLCSRDVVDGIALRAVLVVDGRAVESRVAGRDAGTRGR